jgi:hypothetical protein
LGTFERAEIRNDAGLNAVKLTLASRDPGRLGPLD